MSENAYDLLIRGGTVYDGAGSPGAPADIAIRDGVIVAVGDIDGASNRTVDVGGMSVAPGFIDVHAHDDAAVLGGSMDFKLMQGVTTDIVEDNGSRN